MNKMIRMTVIGLVVVAGSRSLSAQAPAAPAAKMSPLADSIVALEKQSWEAWKTWKKRDGKFYEHFLSDDHVEVGGSGRGTKKEVVDFVASPVCVISGYTLDSFEMKVLAPGVVALTYHADQKTLCHEKPVPAPVWVTSIYVNRKGRWQNAVYQQTKTP
jgi:hypothetical protein